MEYHAPLTPPSPLDINAFSRLQCPGGSASTNASYYPQDWSPETVMTAVTTPPTSPPKIRETGPILLPRVRLQDQSMEPATVPAYSTHSRTSSLPPNDFTMQIGGHLPSRPGMDRRSTSPQGHLYRATPASTPSSFDHTNKDQASVLRPSIRHASSYSPSSGPSHSRNSSSSSIDASVLRRYGYPTYRQSLTPQPFGSTEPMSRTPSAMSHLAPISMLGAPIQSYPSRKRTASSSANPSRLSTQVQFDPVLDGQTSSALEYLTAANPTPSLTQRTVETGRGVNTHFWYDIRTVRAWSDFNVETISAMPDLLRLLQIPVPLRDLPAPSKVNYSPETPTQLVDICAKHHAVKVTAALKLTLGSERYIAMRALKPTGGVRQQPDFVSNYQSDAEQTIYGDGRGRVVGIVKCYDQWNSGMRNGSPTDQVKYLQSLAHLHRFMREHDTRYGFIITEIELVCVRAGGSSPSPTSSSGAAAPPPPLFGYVEVTTPIQIATSGLPAAAADHDGPHLHMTAGLALWWLHMLAKEQPLPGQPHWRLNVGAPADLTRHHHLPRDERMPKPNLSEKREAKRVRGWVFPDEALSKREVGRARKR